jgi:CxxC-x17-CxxC domain-containing protein
MAYGGGGGFRRGGFRRFDSGPREMHKITCSECGKEAEVPFKPREGSPVYCRECFFKRKGITPREPFKPREEAKKEESEVAEEVAEESEEEF